MENIGYRALYENESVHVNTLLLVRHGESEWNRHGRIQGQADTPLTALGEAQAMAIGECLTGTLCDTAFAIYTSPLSRAERTAAIIARKLGREPSAVVVDDRLNDFDLGDITGARGWDDVARRHPELARMRLEDPHRFHPPNGESGADVDLRLRSFLADLPATGIFLLVCHGVINKFIRSIRREIRGGDIIALGESQSTVYRLDGVHESTIEAVPAEVSR